MPISEYTSLRYKIQYWQIFLELWNINYSTNPDFVVCRFYFLGPYRHLVRTILSGQGLTLSRIFLSQELSHRSYRLYTFLAFHMPKFGPVLFPLFLCTYYGKNRQEHK